MVTVYLQDARLLAWASQRLKATFEPTQCRWAAGLVDGGIAWVAVYSHFSERNCLLSLATNGSKRWASRATFRAICAMPFGPWKLARMTFVVAANNEASLKMLRKASGRFFTGAREEGVMRAMFPGDVDGIVFGLLAKECPWI